MIPAVGVVVVSLLLRLRKVNLRRAERVARARHAARSSDCDGERLAVASTG